MVGGEVKRVELMGMDLQVDPYFVEPEGEDDDIFGDARTAVASTEAAAAENNVEHRAAEDAEAETAEARPHGAHSIPNGRPPCLRAHSVQKLVQRMRTLARHW